MFFGTAYQLEQRLSDLISVDPKSAFRHIIIDCKNVSGIDLSAAQRLVDLLSNADSVDSRYGNIVLCCLESSVSDGRASKEFQEKLPTKLFDDLNRALEWAEGHLLNNLHKQSIKKIDECSDNLLINSDMDLLLDLDINRELSQYCQSVTVSAGEFLIHAGQDPDSLYVVEEGRLNILVSNAENTFFCIRSLGKGMILGEIPLYLGGQRSASVQAESNCKLWKLTYVQLRELEKQHASLATAFHKTIAATLAARLKDSARVVRLVG